MRESVDRRFGSVLQYIIKYVGVQDPFLKWSGVYVGVQDPFLEGSGVMHPELSRSQITLG